MKRWLSILLLFVLPVISGWLLQDQTLKNVTPRLITGIVILAILLVVILFQLAWTEDMGKWLALTIFKVRNWITTPKEPKHHPSKVDRRAPGHSKTTKKKTPTFYVFGERHYQLVFDSITREIAKTKGKKGEERKLDNWLARLENNSYDKGIWSVINRFAEPPQKQTIIDSIKARKVELGIIKQHAQRENQVKIAQEIDGSQEKTDVVTNVSPLREDLAETEGTVTPPVEIAKEGLDSNNQDDAPRPENID